MHALDHFKEPLFRHFKSKQQAYEKTHRLLAQDARIINPKFRGTDISLSLDTNNRKGVEFLVSSSTIAELVGLTYLTSRKTRQVKSNTKPYTLIRI